VPVKLSFGARRVGRDPARWMSMSSPYVSVLRKMVERSDTHHVPENK
jgi:hypothetical protein